MTVRARIIASVLIIAIVLAAAVFLSYGRWREAHYFGAVASVSESAVVITDAKTGERSIALDENTKIIAGRDKGHVLAAGDQVIIVAHKENGAIIADVVRVVHPPKKKGDPK